MQTCWKLESILKGEEMKRGRRCVFCKRMFQNKIGLRAHQTACNKMNDIDRDNLGIQKRSPSVRSNASEKKSPFYPGKPFEKTLVEWLGWEVIAEDDINSVLIVSVPIEN
jgi:hypothetical protein